MTQNLFVEHFQAQASSVPPARHAVVTYAIEHGVVDPCRVALAVSEAVTNAIVHAYVDERAGTIEVTAQRHPDDGVVITVSDDGHGVKPRTDSPGLGLGLALIASVAEHGGCRARMVLCSGLTGRAGHLATTR